MTDLPSIEGMPIKNVFPGTVDDPSVDSMLWAGLMCASGDLSSADGIKNCQSKDGRLWRSPAHVGIEVANSFSRDMILGFLMYVAASGDLKILRRWDIYLMKNGKACPESDGRCSITPPIQWHIDHILHDAPMPLVFWPYLMTAALTVPAGFPLHLVGCHILLYWVVTKRKSPKIGRILNWRQPFNPFFMWLAGVDNAEIKVHLERLRGETSASNLTQWAWERRDAESAWRNSMLWDFRFMENLLERVDEPQIY